MVEENVEETKQDVKKVPSFGSASFASDHGEDPNVQFPPTIPSPRSPKSESLDGGPEEITIEIPDYGPLDKHDRWSRLEIKNAKLEAKVNI